jgi:hypothetical protein
MKRLVLSVFEHIDQTKDKILWIESNLCLNFKQLIIIYFNYLFNII